MLADALTKLAATSVIHTLHEAMNGKFPPLKDGNSPSDPPDIAAGVLCFPAQIRVGRCTFGTTIGNQDWLYRREVQGTPVGNQGLLYRRESAKGSGGYMSGKKRSRIYLYIMQVVMMITLPYRLKQCNSPKLAHFQRVVFRRAPWQDLIRGSR